MFASNTSQVSSDATYIEDVFSTYLYTGNGNAGLTINNGIDLSGKGGLTWLKKRSAAGDNYLYDTARGASNALVSNTTAAQVSDSALDGFTSTGFTLAGGTLNDTYASWTFRKQPKFFDVVTYTGTGANRTIAHSLGSTPGCIIVKRTDTTSNWMVYHNGLTSAAYTVQLNSTGAQASSPTVWNSTAPTSTEFSLGTSTTVNGSTGTYVAYLFAHNAGGFGLTGTDNVISCGSFTTDGSGNATVNLGYEPQWILSKASNAAFDWEIADVMRGMSVNTAANALYPNLSSAESTGYKRTPTATGFDVSGVAGAYTFIYIAIRRGPMKTPTSGTSVFAPSTRTGTGATGSSTALGNVTDLTMIKWRAGAAGGAWAFTDRLRGATYELIPSATAAETAYANDVTGFDTMTGFKFGTGSGGRVNTNTYAYIDYLFRRAPGFFDEVCYTGTGVARTVNHNLGVAPELMIVKRRSTSGGWVVYNAFSGATKYLYLDTTGATSTYTPTWNNTAPTSSVFTVGTDTEVNSSGGTFVAYLFATCAGVSKVGSYTGTGTTQQINCGFTAGARFVLIKRTDSTGDWYVWDSARGIVAGNDPYLLLNSTAAEVTNTDYVDAYAAGFEISSTAPAAINASGGTFIYLAIA